jgi:hypothetical protein
MKCLSLTVGSRVYGLDDLRTADGSIVPRVPAEYDGSLSGHWRARRGTDSADLPNLIHCIADVQA